MRTPASKLRSPSWVAALGPGDHRTALLNTAQLEDKTWFIILLVLGLFSFGLFAMIAYVIGGPDGIRQPRPSVDVQGRL